jgi:ribonuclease HI
MPETDWDNVERPAGELTAQRARDIGQFDGSADPNPGGRMGMGWHLVMRDGREYTGQAEERPAPSNSNNQAEYLALLALLDEYVAAGGQGPLLVRGDSQLVILQMTGEWRVRHPGLLPLYERARQTVKGIPNGVRFEWVPRRLNATADRLASGRAAGPAGSAQALTYAVAPIQDVSPPLAERIAALNGKGSVSFKEYLALRVGGKDRCSQMPWSELVSRAGPDYARACAEAFPDDQRSQATALRWAVRGLAVQLAIEKVKVDQQVMAAKRTSPS